MQIGGRGIKARLDTKSAPSLEPLYQVGLDQQFVGAALDEGKALLVLDICHNGLPNFGWERFFAKLTQNYLASTNTHRMTNQKTRILAHLQAASENRSRHFWVGAMVAGISLFGMMAAFGTAPENTQILAHQQTVVEQIPFPIGADQPQSKEIFVREERVQQGDTVAALLLRLGVQDEQAFGFLRQNPEARPIFHQLRPGKVVTAHTGENGELIALAFPLNGSKDNALIVDRRNDKLQVGETVQSAISQMAMKTGEIRTSLFAATDAIGLPDSIATQMAEIFGGDIDFHRDLRKGDRFSVVYETLHHQSQPVRTGRILAAEFINHGRAFRALWFDSPDGQGYYSAAGKNIRKAFLRSPIEFSRISSGFTHSRLHPIHNIRQAHKGVDYAAPIGTGVRATGDGTVEFVGKQGGYGNLIVVRHQGRYSTYYGHLNGFAPSVRKGVRVNQGDVIGYVGRTGVATGPHLHYEFRINGLHQNPLTLALPSAPALSPQTMAEFRKHTDPLIYRLDMMVDMRLALLD